MMKKVMLLVGAGLKTIVGDKKMENTENIAAILNNTGFDAFPMKIDLSDRASIQEENALPELATAVESSYRLA